MRTLSFIVFSLVSLTGLGQTMEGDTLKQFTKEATAAHSVMKIEPFIVRTINGQNLGEVLQMMSSAFIKTNGPGGISTISLRGGSASQTQVYWEGIAINSPTLGQTDLSLLPSEFFNYVNINHSGASTHFGLGGIAGSLDMRSSSFSSYGGDVMFKKEIGSFGLDNTSAMFSAGLPRVYFETVLIKKTAQNNFVFRDHSMPGSPQKKRTNSAFSQYGFQEKIDYKTKKGRLKLIINYLDTEREIPVAIGVREQDQYQVDKNFKSSLQYKDSKAKHGDGEDYRAFSHKFNLGFVHDYQNYSNLASDIDASYNTSNFSAQFHSTYELKKKWTINTHLNEYYYRAISDGFDETKFQNRLAGYVGISKKWNSTFLSGAIQELLVNQHLSAPIISLGTYQMIQTGKLEHKLFANAGTNYRYPTLNDLYWTYGGNELLNPEQSINYEIGLKSNYFYTKYPIEYSLTFFQDWVNNWIQWIPDETGVWSPENVKTVQKKGFECSITYRQKIKHSQYFIFSASHRWVDAHIAASTVSDDEIGKALIYTPEHVINIDGTLQLKRLFLRYNQTITGKFYLDRTNTTYLPYSAPANLEIGYSLKDENKDTWNRFDVAITIHNIWAEEYQIVANQPMPGRWGSVKLSYKFRNHNFGKQAYD